jgi:outer membrane protein assembly factor BamB
VATDDRQRAAALERFWDGLVHEADPEPKDVDPEIAEIARRVHALGEDPDPGRARAQVWERLTHHPMLRGTAMSISATLTHPPIRVPQPPRAQPAVPAAWRRTSPRWAMNQLNQAATALLLVLTLGAIYFVIANRPASTPGSGVRPDDWPTFRGNAGRTGVVGGPAIPSQPAVAWTVTGRRAFFSPSIANGVIFALSGDGVLHALDAATGAERWTFATGGTYNAAPVAFPAVDGGIVYVGAPTGTLFALDAETGTRRWTVTVGGSLTTPLLVYDGLVYAGSADGNLYAFEGKTGEERWRSATGPITSAGPAADGGAIFAASDDGTIVALDLATGAERWRYAAGSKLKTLVATDGLVYASGDASDLIAVDARTGIERWRFTATGNAPPAVAGGIVYVSIGDTDVYALDAATGAVVWQIRLKGSSSIVVTGSVLYGVASTGLYALDAATGQQLWLAGGVRANTPPSVAEGMIFVAGGNGVLTAFAPSPATPTP